jgi:S1-C subfamily serine protease
MVAVLENGQGSGVVVGHNREGRLMVLTAAHLFHDGEEPGLPPRGPKILVIRPGDGKSGQARIGRLHALDRGADLALIEVLGPLPLEPVPLASAEPRTFDVIYQMASIEYEPRVVQQGIFAAKGRPRSGNKTHTFYSFSGTCWPGMSGSPVLNTRGELVSILLAIYTEDDEDEHKTLPTVCYSAPLPDIKTFLGMNGVLP